MNLMKSAIELFCRNCSAEPLSAANTCCFDETLKSSFEFLEFRSKMEKNRVGKDTEEGQSEPMVEQFDGNEDDGGIEVSSERELCTIALCNPANRNFGCLQIEDMVTARLWEVFSVSIKRVCAEAFDLATWQWEVQGLWANSLQSLANQPSVFL
jgi:hypothetical protein